MSLRPRRPLPGRLARLPRLVRRALPLAFAAALCASPSLSFGQDVFDRFEGVGNPDDAPNAVSTLGAPASEDALPGDPNSPEDADADLLETDADAAGNLAELFDLQRVRTEQLATEAGNAIDRVRTYVSRDPDFALAELKDALLFVRNTQDVDPVVKAQLVRQLEAEIHNARNFSIRADESRLADQVRDAEGIAQARLLAALRTEEENLEQLIDQVRASIDDAVHGDDFAYEEAEDTARAAVNLRPGNPPATAAVFTAEAAGQLNKAFRLRSIRNDCFLETLYQVELSHVPFPDEPPVRFPAAAVWEELSRRRIKRYSAVSLQADSPAEEKIRAALQQPASLTGIRPGDTMAVALDLLAQQFQITILPDGPRLDLEGLDLRELPIENPPELEGVKLKSALKLLLENAGDVPLTYIIEDEVMKITTQDHADEQLFTRVYPVGDLVIPIISGGMGGGGLGGRRARRRRPGRRGARRRRPGRRGPRRRRLGRRRARRGLQPAPGRPRPGKKSR